MKDKKQIETMRARLKELEDSVWKDVGATFRYANEIRLSQEMTAVWSCLIEAKNALQTVRQHLHTADVLLAEKQF